MAKSNLQAAGLALGMKEEKGAAKKKVPLFTGGRSGKRSIFSLWKPSLKDIFTK